MSEPKVITQNELAGFLIEHHQKSYELTFEMWRYRNRIFLYLIATLAVAAALTFPIQETRSLLVDAVANVVGIDDANRINDLRTSFPFELFQTVLMSAIFYLMVNLYHRTSYVLRSYRYLDGLEKEIRKCLGLNDGIAFTREGTFYSQTRPFFLGAVKYVYIGIIGVLLGVFLYQRFLVIVPSTSFVLQSADIAIGIASLVFFIAYALSALGIGNEKRSRTDTEAQDTRPQQQTP